MASLALVPAADAQDPADPLGTLGDPLELDRHVAAVGDDAVLEALTNEDSPLASRLGAIRAARWLEAPERALLALAALAGGDDPDLAPAAARAGRDCAEAIGIDDLAIREGDPAALAEAATRWSAVAADESARADIRAMAAVAAQSLSR